jgi:hypothetical protein
MSKPEIDAQHELATLIHRNSEIDIRVWAKTMRRYGEALEERDARLTSSAHLCRDAIKVA